MSKIVEPPVLMSRILMFVLATSVVVLGALVITLVKMVPLTRPEVFFLQTPTRSVNVVIKPLVPDQINQEALESYEKGFIREYIIARNTLNPNATTTRTNWTRVVKPWSSNKVFSDFTKTTIYHDYTFSNRAPQLSCSVNFPDSNRERAIIKTKDSFFVNFTWLCENISGQTTRKNYNIRIKVQSILDDDTPVTPENLKKLAENPLGIQVTEYEVQGNNKTDPLNSDINAW